MEKALRLSGLAAMLLVAGLSASAHADKKGGTVLTGPIDCEHEQEQVQKCTTQGNPPKRVCEWVWVTKPDCAVYLQTPGGKKKTHGTPSKSP
jgi:hypothetical protein